MKYACLNHSYRMTLNWNTLSKNYRHLLSCLHTFLYDILKLILVSLSNIKYCQYLTPAKINSDNFNSNWNWYRVYLCDKSWIISLLLWRLDECLLTKTCILRKGTVQSSRGSPYEGSVFKTAAYHTLSKVLAVSLTTIDVSQ